MTPDSDAEKAWEKHFAEFPDHIGNKARFLAGRQSLLDDHPAVLSLDLFLDAIEQLELYCPNPDVVRQFLSDVGLDPDYSPLDDSSREHRWALIDRPQQACATCGGSGMVLEEGVGIGSQVCPNCGGEGCQNCYDGAIPVQVQTQEPAPCPDCDGSPAPEAGRLEAGK